jgi:pyruvate-formate lyase-activating enzyme
MQKFDFNKLLLEVSTKRQSAWFDIKSVMTPLIGHLIMIDILGDTDLNYKKHLGEIEEFTLDIVEANAKSKRKVWFSTQTINEISTEHMQRGIRFFQRKYPNVPIKKEYKSLEDFPWFKLYGKE